MNAACRKGRPYVTRREYEESLKPIPAAGAYHANPS